jgi:hypothetical protein
VKVLPSPKVPRINSAVETVGPALQQPFKDYQIGQSVSEEEAPTIGPEEKRLDAIARLRLRFGHLVGGTS